MGKSKARMASESFVSEFCLEKELIKPLEDLLKSFSTRGKSKTPSWMPLTECRDMWHEHVIDHCDGVPPNWKTEMKPLKELLAKFREVWRRSEMDEDMKDNDCADWIEMKFESFLKSRPKWSDFHKKNFKMAFINAELPNIIAHLSNGGINKEKFKDGVSQAADRVAGKAK